MKTSRPGSWDEVGTPARAWLVVALLWFAGCSNFLSRVMVTTMHESITGTIPLTEAEFSLLTAVFLWVYGFFSPVAGFLSDRFGRSVVIVTSMLAWSLVTTLTAGATTFPQLIATRVALGVSEACYLPAALALISDYHRGGNRSLATGVHSTGIMAGWALSGLGGWLAEQRSWPEAFGWVGGGSLLFCVLLMLTLRDPPRATPAPEDAAPALRFTAALRSLFGRPAFRLLLIYSGVLGAVGWVIVGWIPVFMQERFRLTQGAAGVLTTAYVSGSSLAGVLIGGAWADRWNRTHPRGPIFVTAIGLLVAAPAVMAMASTPILSVALLALVIYGLTTSFSDVNSMPILCLVSDPRYRATGYGVLNFLTCIAGGIAIFLGGVLRDAGFSLQSILLGSALALLASAGLLLLVKSSGPAPASALGLKQAGAGGIK